MCRFVAYQGPPIAIADLFVRPAHSLIRQSFDAQERPEPLNGDGFGVAWYIPERSPEPGLFRSITPAWNDENLLSLANVTHSGTILAHVRAATVGSVVQTNCHPFTAGRYSFMHNGHLEGFKQIRRRLLASLSDDSFSIIRGSTDTEHLFALLLDRLAEQEDQPPARRMAAALEATLHQAAELAMGQDAPSRLNLVLTDGNNTVVSRAVLGDPAQANTLYMRQVENGQRYRCEGGVCYIVDADNDGPAVLFASEPLFDHGEWTPIEPNQIVIVDHDRNVTQRSITLPS